MSSRWPLARTLSERLDALRRSAAPESADASLAEKRLDRWKSSQAFADESVFRRFLETESLTETELRQILGEDLHLLQARSAPRSSSWLETLHEAFAMPVPTGFTVSGYLKVVKPLLAHYQLKLRDRARALALEPGPVPFDPETVVGLFVPWVTPRLLRLLQRTMVLETNIARLEERLQGSTPEQRFESFLRSLDDPAESLRLLEEYPVLARLCVTLLDQWLEAAGEFLDRLYRDRAVLEETFGLAKSGPIASVMGGAGDAHQKGRSVLIVTFQSGARLVYKPRSVAADRGFQELVRWINAEGLEPRLATYEILDRGTHGWVEFIPFTSCTEPEEIARFYQRQGAWLALLYVLGATDLHMENLVARGEHPVIVDLETLFHPRSFLPAGTWADEIAQERMSDSVISVGLLPLPTPVKGRTYDTSALGATAHQTTPFEVDGFEGVGTDEVRIAKVEGKTGEIHSRPMLGDRPAEISSHYGDIEAGFSRTYELLCARRDTLLSGSGPLEKFRATRIRAVLRPSAGYASLLYESFHPKLLRDAVNRDLFLSQLWEEVARRPALAPAVPSERRQLLEGDIPYFTTLPTSTDLQAGEGPVISGVLVKSGWEGARERIERLGEEDRRQQTWMVRASLACLGTEGFPRATPPRSDWNFLHAARAIGDRLAETAVLASQSATWIALHYQGNEASPEAGHYQIGILDYDLYGGLAGVSFFLAYLSLITGETSYRELAEKSLATTIRRVEQRTPQLAPGGFSGLASAIYLYTHLAHLWGRDDLLDRAEALLPELQALIDKDTALDLITGSASCIPILIALDRARPRCPALAIAIRCGERILHVGWSNLRLPRGFSHGISGLAWALSELGHVTKEGRFDKAASRAATDEDALLGGDRWTDIPGNQTGASWCHGAPGIALSRLQMYRRNPGPSLRQSAQRALETLLKSPPLPDHSLCHGALGNLEPLHTASEVFAEEPHWKTESQTRARAILDDINRSGWRTPLDAGIIQPGLMTGAAGIGYGLLRAAARDRVPSVLTLGPPV